MSYFDLSLDAVNKAYSWGWRLSLAAGVATALGVLLLTWAARVREYDFEEQVASLRSRATTSEERAASLQREAAQLRLAFAREEAARDELLQVERRLTAAASRVETEPAGRTRDPSQPASRHVTQEQQDRLFERLQRFRNRVVIRFEPNQEAAEYAVAIRDIFTRAGVPFSFDSAANPSGLTGIRMAMIMTPGEGEPLPAAKEMSSIMQDSGFPLERPIHWRSFPRSDDDPLLDRSRSARPSDVLIFIGAKPPPR